MKFFYTTLLLLLAFNVQLNAQERSVKQLNDRWQFVLLDEEIDYLNLNDTSWQDIQIPHTWNTEDIQSGNSVHYGTGFYRRELLIEKENTGKQFFLRFEGVGQYMELYINDKYVGKHLGGYSAFVFNITNFLIDDEANTIFVKVNNELADSYPKDNFLFGIYGENIIEIKVNYDASTYTDKYILNVYNEKRD